jgi:hypothetical protein
MKTKCIVWIAGLVLILAGCNKNTGPNDFRQADWGMSPSEVKSSEGKAPEWDSEEIMYFEENDEGTISEIYYAFADGALVEGQVKVIANYEKTIREMMGIYEGYAAQLTETYGAPLDDDYLVWLDDDPAFIGDPHEVSIYNQRLEYFLEWQTETSYITLELNYKDAQINLIHNAKQLEPAPQQ